MIRMKEYIFEHYDDVTYETLVEAKSYAEAEKIFLSGGGTTDESNRNGSGWEFISEHEK